MKTRKILCPIDFSTLDQTALETATAIARDRGATLLIVHVQEPPHAYAAGDFYYGIEAPDRSELEQMLLKKVVPAGGTVKYEHRLVVGDPAGAIINLAETEAVDMIVLASHGRTGLLRLLMGSVAEAVVRRAKCPVLAVMTNANIQATKTIQKEPSHA